MKQDLILFLTSFLVTILITVPVARRLALCLKIVDIPDLHLKRHHQITPYLGGAAIFVSLWLNLFWFFDLYKNNLIGLLIGTSLIFLAGLVDDLIVLSPLKKFSCQLMTAIFLVGSGFSSSLAGLLYVDQIFSIFWIVALMNAFNLVDVMDGLAAIIGICICTSLLGYTFWLGQDFLSGILLILLGSLIAFFYYNRPLASIYLGDAGSMLIGTVLSVVALKINWISLNDKTFLSALIAPIIFSIPIMEVVSLILIRRLKKIPFYNGSPDHYIHYLKYKNWSEWQILGFTVLYSLLLFLFSMSVAFFKTPFFLLLAISLMLQGLWLHVVFSKNRIFGVKKSCCNK